MAAQCCSLAKKKTNSLFSCPEDKPVRGFVASVITETANVLAIYVITETASVPAISGLDGKLNVKSFRFASTST